MVIHGFKGGISKYLQKVNLLRNSIGRIGTGYRVVHAFPEQPVLDPALCGIEMLDGLDSSEAVGFLCECKDGIIPVLPGLCDEHRKKCQLIRKSESHDSLPDGIIVIGIEELHE